MNTRTRVWALLLPCAFVGSATCSEPPVNAPQPMGLTETGIDWIRMPDAVLDLGEAAAFTTPAAAGPGVFHVDLSSAVPPLDDSDDLLLFEHAETGLKARAHQDQEGVLTATLDPSKTYLVFPNPRARFLDTYQTLCFLRRVRLDLVPVEPMLPDRICQLILCGPDFFDAPELMDRFPPLRDLGDRFPAAVLANRRLGGFGSEPGAGGVCERCLTFTRPVVPELPLLPVDCPLPAASRVKVVNIIPNALSAEVNQDSEPNLAVNPADPRQIAASAFTPNPLAAGNAPIFVSTDGGDTWAMNFIVPTQSGQMTGDITTRFGGSSNVLYAGILRRPGLVANQLRLNILSTGDFTNATTMTVLVDRNGPDQPYVQATTAGGADRVFVGDNDLGLFPGRTATIDRSADGTNFTNVVIEARNTSGQDQPPIRPAIAPGSVIYAAFFSRRVGGSDVVVVRDDAGGVGASPFVSLLDTDGVAGVRVVTGRNVPFENFSHANFGQERLVASNLSIAADPTDAAHVCVAWGDRVATEPLTLHVRCSSDSGATWSTADLRTVGTATNPALAFSSRGRAGFLYQELTGTGAASRWVTRIEVADGDFANRTTFDLANTPATSPAPQFLPYLGDYVHLMAVGTDFFGIFSANNTPDEANFPQGVTYQREADFVSKVLTDAGGTAVPVSIDPFFFQVSD